MIGEDRNPPRHVQLLVYGVAQPAGSKIAGRTKAGKLFVRDDAKHSAPWKTDVRKAAGEAMDGAPLFEGPLGLAVTFTLPRPRGHFGTRGLRPSAPPFPIVRPDATKLLRAVEDALTGIVWRDDAQVVQQIARKIYGEPACCEVLVWQLTSLGIMLGPPDDSSMTHVVFPLQDGAEPAPSESSGDRHA